MNRKTLLAAAALVALFGTATVVAQQTQPPPQQPRQKLDANGDGVIDRAEAAKFPRLAERFDQLDTNKDGKLQPSEMPMHGMRGPGMQGGMDHAAMQARFAQRKQQMFADMDTNKDGKVTRAEMQAFHAKKQAERAQQHAQRFDEHFKRMDSNGDGVISQEEFAKAGFGGHRGPKGMKYKDGRPAAPATQPAQR